VRVTDNGSPPLSNSTPVTIIVNEVNTPPTLATITNRTVTLGEAVSFNVTVTDADLPAQQVAFDFAAVVPAGATIGTTNGLFSWIVNTVGTNTFAIRATDNGSPALSDTKTFDVIVTSQFQITTIAVSNNVVALKWSALSGRSYNVEYKNSLSDSNWTPLATNIVATTNSAFASDIVGTNTQRIYRIVLQP
jgi:hypothetical protein